MNEQETAMTIKVIVNIVQFYFKINLVFFILLEEIMRPFRNDVIKENVNNKRRQKMFNECTIFFSLFYKFVKIEENIFNLSKL